MNARHRSRPTLQDVANIAGVSVATASMALRGNPRTAESTQRSVRAAAAKLNYVPDRRAQGLRVQRTGVVALVVPHSSEHFAEHPYFMPLMNGIQESLNAAGMMLMLSTSAIERDTTTPYLRVLQSHAADGVIVASARTSDRNVLQLAAAGFPAVFIGRYPDTSDITAVGIDDIGGGMMATDHLIEAHDKRCVAHIAGPRDSRSGIERLDGYRRSLGRHGLAYDEELVAAGDYDRAAGASACRRLLGRGVPFDSLFVCNDDAAVGAIEVLRDSGRSIPDDVAIVSFDDGLLAPVVSPALTTIRQPVRDLGIEAATRLLGILDDPTTEARQVELPIELVLRQSCGCH